MPEVDASRGTVVWGFNKFRSDALVQLLNDLITRESIGLSDDQCQTVRVYLSKVVGVATEIPDGAWLKDTVWTSLQEFEQLYVVWNSHAGMDAPAKRKLTLKAMRRKRDRLSRKIRNNQLILATESDAKLLNDVYGALGDLSRSLPEVFRSLSSAVNRFHKYSE
jgi:hypothetical protein